jgi:hypothetical protein
MELQCNGSASGPLCQRPSAPRLLLLAAPHILAARLVRCFNAGHLAHEQLSAAGQHIQARGGLEALPGAQVGCLGSPQLAGLAGQLGLALGPLGVDLGQLEPNRLAALVLHPAIELTDNADDISLSVQFLSVLMAGRDRDIDINRLLNRRRDAREVGWTPKLDAQNGAGELDGRQFWMAGNLGRLGDLTLKPDGGRGAALVLIRLTHTAHQ